MKRSLAVFLEREFSLLFFTVSALYVSVSVSLECGREGMCECGKGNVVIFGVPLLAGNSLKDRPKRPFFVLRVKDAQGRCYRSNNTVYRLEFPLGLNLSFLPSGLVGITEELQLFFFFLAKCGDIFV